MSRDSAVDPAVLISETFLFGFGFFGGKGVIALITDLLISGVMNMDFCGAPFLRSESVRENFLEMANEKIRFQITSFCWIETSHLYPG